ncbi:SUMO1 sentrin specific peptidase 1 [Coemansia biformis]|uniref:SUMO1 sentrin specific peptidase 1 n=1 Tax=Coemansia biformis TaxID=1286918 RepID=A0A9W7Y6I8_9FUNG|nr:SUMO1 sentrin specific peptidase 1 [Coemansia biformis]
MADGARPEWLGPPSAGTSTAAYDSTPAPSQATADDGRADTRSILSVDSSLGFRDTVPLWQSGRVLSPSGSDATTGLVAGAWRRGPAAASGAGKAAGGSGAAEAWLAQLRKKIEDALSVSYPAAVVATSAYDRLRQREESFDERLEKARQQTAFALPANAAEVLKRAAAAGFVVELNNVPVTAHDMATLQDGKWLNDEVINFYMQLIMDRSAKTPALPRVHAFNTFFYSTLCESGYARVRRWTRRTKLFEKDLVIVPVHLGVHWCCAVIDLRQKSIVYYDALLGDDPGCLQTLMGYIRDESRDKCGADIDESEWTLRCDKRIPRQQNGYDCGVFAVMFAEYASRDAPFQFSQENCPFLRRRVTYEIATVSLTPAIA